MNKLAAELAQLDRIPGLHHMHGNSFHPVFLQFQVHQCHGQLGAVDMCRGLLENIGRGTDMILMSVGEKITADMIPFAHQIGDVRNHQIHAEHVFLRKHTAAVHNNDVVFIFKNIHVFANLIHTAQGNNPQSANFFFLCLRTHREPPFVQTNT